MADVVPWAAAVAGEGWAFVLDWMATSMANRPAAVLQWMQMLAALLGDETW